MDELQKKYLKDNLDLDSLKELKEKVAEQTDSQLEDSMYQYWMNDYIDEDKVDNSDILRLKKRIDNINGYNKSTKTIILRAISVAAAILLPIFIFFTIYLYNNKTTKTDSMMVVATASGEKASITLPDGTKVALNEDTKLEYKPGTYNTSERNIKFNGEAYFEVAKNKDCPFIINTGRLIVKVLGTKFNLSARKNSKEAQLTLKEGRVVFCSVMTSRNVILHPIQQAILNYQNGHITVKELDAIDNVVAWKSNEKIFDNESLSNVIRYINKQYNVNIIIKSNYNSKDLFTGTIPTNDLYSAIGIIKESYHLKSFTDGKNILMTGK